MKALIGQKLSMGQKFDKEGNVLPFTAVEIKPAVILQIKTKKTDGYGAVKLAYGEGKGKYNKKSTLGEMKKAGLKKAPQKILEIAGDSEGKGVGDEVKMEEVFKVGEEISVTGWSKGRGFSGVMKRWGFHGGPATHGQSDRLRAPGSIGQGTDPGRVHRGKKMPGRYGSDRKTVKGLKILEIDKENNRLLISGAIPGARRGYVIICKK